MSVASSSSSMMSVSVFGEEMTLNNAMDQVFKEIQSRINNCHCSIREMSMMDDRNEPYIESLKIHCDVDEFITELGALFKELKSVSKQVLGKCPKEEKQECDEYMSKRKVEREYRKAQEKIEKEMAKASLNK